MVSVCSPSPRLRGCPQPVWPETPLPPPPAQRHAGQARLTGVAEAVAVVVTEGGPVHGCRRHHCCSGGRGRPGRRCQLCADWREDNLAVSRADYTFEENVAVANEIPVIRAAAAPPIPRRIVKTGHIHHFEAAAAAQHAEAALKAGIEVKLDGRIRGTARGGVEDNARAGQREQCLALPVEHLAGHRLIAAGGGRRGNAQLYRRRVCADGEDAG